MWLSLPPEMQCVAFALLLPPKVAKNMGDSVALKHTPRHFVTPPPTIQGASISDASGVGGMRLGRIKKVEFHRLTQ